MAGRIRSIKPEILEDERSAGLSSDAWRLWVSMWLLADDHGRLRGAAQWLHSQVFWSCPHAVSVPDLLAELDAAGVIVRYEVNGQKYIEIPGWSKHQKIDHKGKPRIPGPYYDSSRDSRETSRDSRETLAKVSETLAPDLRSPISDQDQRPTTSDLLKLSSPSAPDPVLSVQFDFASVYDAYPRKEGRTKGIARLRSQVRTPEAFEQLRAAVRHYADKCRLEATEPRFVKHFSTWANGVWRDYVDGPNVVDLSPANRTREFKNFQGPRTAVAETKDVEL
jgi:hypothetical protein